MAFDLTALGRDAFDAGAYLEVAVSNGSSVTAWWSDLWLMLGSSWAVTAKYSGWTLPTDGNYHFIQVPLSELDNGGSPLTYDLLSGGLFGFCFGSSFDAMAVGRVDEMRIRW